MDNKLLVPRTTGFTIPTISQSTLSQGIGGNAGMPFFWRGAYDNKLDSTQGTVYRIPFGCKTSAGSLLFFWQEMLNISDTVCTSIMMRRSANNGLTWSPSITVAEPVAISNAKINANAGGCVVDNVDGTIWVLYNQYAGNNYQAGDPLPRIYATYSTRAQDGLHWSPSGSGYPTSDISDLTNPSGWEYIAISPTNGIQKNYSPFKNRLLMPALHRITRAGTSYLHLLYMDHAATPNPQNWTLGWVQPTGAANNQDSNEPNIVERKSSGHRGELYINCRNVGSNSTKRGYTRSTDGGVTFDDILFETVTYNSTSASMVYAGNYVLIAHPKDGSARKRVSIRHSGDDTAGFTQVGKELCFQWGGYSSLIYGNDGYVHCLAEKGDTGTGTGDGDTWARYLAYTKFSPAWAVDPSGNGQYFQWNFNEFASGVTALPGIYHTNSIIDYGTMDIRANPSGTGGAMPIYTDGRFGQSALSIVANSFVWADDSTWASPSGGNFGYTFEGAIRVQAGQSGTILNTAAAAVSNVGTSLVINAAGKLVASIYRIGGSQIITSTNSVADGTWHPFAYRQNRGIPHSSTLIIWDSDGSVNSSQVSSSDSNTYNPATATAPLTLGRANTGVSQLVFDIDMLKYTRGFVTDANLIVPTYTKAKPFVVPSYADDVTTLLTSSNVKLWVPSYRLGNQFYDPVLSFPMPSSAIFGDPIHSMWELSPAHRYLSKTEAASAHPTIQVANTGVQASDIYVGPSWAFRPLTNNDSYGISVQSSNTAYDFIQSTGVFTLALFLKPMTPTGGSFGQLNPQILFDNTDFGGSGCGVTLAVNGANNRPRLFLYNNGATLLDTTPAGPSIPFDEWTFLAVTCNGSGTPLIWYTCPAASGDTSLIVQNSGTNLSNISSNPSLTNLKFGHRALTTGYAYYGNMVDIVITNNQLSLEQLKLLFNRTKNWQTRSLYSSTNDIALPIIS